jgi:hypothetical protein
VSARPDTAASRRPHRRPQALWASLAVLCLATQLSSVAHLVLVEHVRCTEHGAWIHAGDEHARAHVEHSASASDAPAVVPDAGAAAEDHEHDHCLASTERRKLALLLLASAELPPLRPTALAATADHATHVVARAVHTLAPKTSPPT